MTDEEIIKDDIAVLCEELHSRPELAKESYLELSRRIDDARQKGIEV